MSDCMHKFRPIDSSGQLACIHCNTRYRQEIGSAERVDNLVAVIDKQDAAIKQLRGSLDAAEQHVKILQQQREQAPLASKQNSHELATMLARAIFQCGDEPLAFGGKTQRIQFMGGTYPDSEKAMGGLGEGSLAICIRRALDHVGACETSALPKSVRSALEQIKNGPPIEMENGEVAAWAAGLAENALQSVTDTAEKTSDECPTCHGIGSQDRPYQLGCGHRGPFRDEHGYYEKRRLQDAQGEDLARYKQALQRANGYLIMNSLEPVKLEYSSVKAAEPRREYHANGTYWSCVPTMDMPCDFCAGPFVVHDPRTHACPPVKTSGGTP